MDSLDSTYRPVNQGWAKWLIHRPILCTALYYEMNIQRFALAHAESAVRLISGIRDVQKSIFLNRLFSVRGRKVRKHKV